MHYDKGYFDYRRDGFGAVFTDSKDLVDYLMQTINSNYFIEDTYLQRSDKNFLYRDKNNCYRVFKRITEILE